MKNLFRPYLTAFIMGSLLFASTSCKDDDPTPEEDGELITTVTLTLTPEGKGQNVTATFSDPDGDGGVDAVVQTLNLAPNTVYNTTVTFSDESKTPPVDITAEIDNEAEEHEVFYEALGGLNISEIRKTDIDNNNRPIGLTATITTGAASTGTLRVTLKHQPGGAKGNTSDITKGETDVQANFPAVIQ